MLVLALLQLPQMIFAQGRAGNADPAGGAGNADPAGGAGNADPAGGAGIGGGQVVTIDNPLRAQNLTQFLLDIIQILLVLAVPIIVFFIILAGFKFVTAQGNETELAKAKQALLYAIIGGLLILGAFVILEVIQGTVASFQANP